MKSQSKFILVISAVAVFVLLLSTSSPFNFISQTISPQAVVNITIKTTPASCTVTLSGVTLISPVVKNSGTTGAIFPLNAGIYSAKVEKSGYTTKTVAVLVASLPNMMTVTLTAIVGPVQQFSYTVKTTPASCSVSVDGGTAKDSGTTGAVFTVASGAHTVKITKSGYTTKETSTSVTAAKTESFTLVATAPPAPTTYALTVKTTPSSCSVTISGTTKDSGTSGAVFNLASNTYSVTISKSGYTSQTVSYTISGAALTKTVTLTASPSPPPTPPPTPPANIKPIKPSISYPPSHQGYIGDNQKFELNAWDDDENEQLEYRMDWGTGWTSWTAFTTERNEGGYTKVAKQVSYTWMSSWSGNIRAQSRDDGGLESDIYDYSWSAIEKPFYDLTITTTPSDCDVTVSGGGSQNSGSYGASFNLQMGTYTVTVSKQGYETDSSTVTLDKSKTLEFYLMLITYKLTVSTNPAGCDVKLETTTKNSGTAGAGFSGLTPGIYSFTVSKTGYVSKTETASLIDSNKAVTVTLEQIQVNLRVMTNPSNCDVTFQGQTRNSGTTGALFQNVLSGTYAVQASKQYYGAVNDTVAIVDTDVSKTITLDRSHFNLTVITTPNLCDVTVDGITKSSGTGSLIKFNYLSKGKHIINVAKDEYVASSTTYNLEKDDSVRIRLTGQTYVLTVNTVPSDCTVTVKPGVPVPLSDSSDIITKTSTNGVATFDVEQGDYQVTASKTGFTIETKGITVSSIIPISGGNTVDFVLTPAHILTVITQPAGCTVTVQGVGTQTSNEEGKAVFFNVQKNTYNITVSKTGFTDFKTPITVDNDATYAFSLSERTVEKKTPGFEILTLIVALGVIFILTRKKKQ